MEKATPASLRSPPIPCVSNLKSVNARLGLDVLNLVSERVIAHTTAIEGDLATIAAPAFKPADGVVHPLATLL